MPMSYGPGELLHGGTGGHISSLKSQFMETEAWHSFVSESQVISSWNLNTLAGHKILRTCLNMSEKWHYALKYISMKHVKHGVSFNLLYQVSFI